MSARPSPRVLSGTNRRVRWPFGAGVALAVAPLAFASCSRPPSAAPPIAQAASAQATPTAGGSVPHGDHNPHHGGVVMMKGDDLHYEVVLDPTGRSHRVYFSDAVREDLPAAVASDVVLTIRRPGAGDERIAMQIDDAGESWVGSGRAVAAPASTNARLAFTMRQEPYWIDLPFAAAK
jgi:hypothetical protein